MGLASLSVALPTSTVHGFEAKMMGGDMLRITMFVLVFICMISYHFCKLSYAKKKTAIEIFDMLYIHERETKPDHTDESGMKFYTPVKYAKRMAIVDCEELIYNKYKLWE